MVPKVSAPGYPFPIVVPVLVQAMDLISPLPMPQTIRKPLMWTFRFSVPQKHMLKVSVEVRRLQCAPRYKEPAKLLRSIPGIGPLTTVELLSEIQDINRFPSFKKFNGFIGFRPGSHSSGEHDWKGSMTYRRHKALRSSLIECAWTTIQKDPIMLQRYNEPKTRLTGKRAIVIIARKLVSRIYAVLKNEKPYELGLAK
jgi:transposase